MTYIIDYGLGNTETIEGTLDEAKAAADGGAEYLQCDIVILDESGAEMARRRWWGTEYDPTMTESTEDEIIQFGCYGYFGEWE